MIRRLLAIGLLMPLLWSCTLTSPAPVQHLQLSAGDTQPAVGDKPLIVIDTVVMPDFLLRDELLIREDDYALRYDPLQRWAEPLDLAVQRVIAVRLGARLGTRRIVRLPLEPAVTPDGSLSIEVRHLESTSQQARMVASGRWTGPGGAHSRTVDFEAAVPLQDSDGRAIASALSQLIWQFSEQLAEAFDTLPDSRDRETSDPG